MLAAARKRREFGPLGLAEFNARAYIHACLLIDRGTDEQLNRMTGVSRSGKTFTPKQGQYLAFIHLYKHARATGIASSIRFETTGAKTHASFERAVDVVAKSTRHSRKEKAEIERKKIPAEAGMTLGPLKDLNRPRDAARVVMPQMFDQAVDHRRPSFDGSGGGVGLPCA